MASPASHPLCATCLRQSANGWHWVHDKYQPVCLVCVHKQRVKDYDEGAKLASQRPDLLPYIPHMDGSSTYSRQ
jgi:hypothetical protein